MTAAAALDLARRHLAGGNGTAARQQAQVALHGAASPAERAAAHVLLAAIEHAARAPAQALTHLEHASRLGLRDASALYLRAEILEALQRAPEAIEALRDAVRAQPAFVAAWFYLGILEGEAGGAEAAAKAFGEAVRLEPRHARAWNNLGNALRTLGDLPRATQAFEHAVAIKPDYPLAVANLAKALRDVGEVERAEAILRATLARPASGPQFRPLLVLLAGLLRERGQLDEAATLYRQAIDAAPRESAGEWFNLGWVLTERGEPGEARACHAKAFALDPKELRGLLGRELTLPMIYAGEAHLDAARDAYAQGLDRLADALPEAAARLSPAAAIDGLRWTNFFLAYQGGDDRALQARYAGIVARAIDRAAPQWRTPVARRPGKRRLRIGFASAFFHVGTVGRYFQSWITGLDRERFAVHVYHLWPGMDDIATRIHARADVFRSFGGSDARPSVVAPAIRDDALDVLVYPELGMDVASFALAALRLAPRQIAAWGHPVTTGHSTIDTFVSCAAMEPPGAATQYTERLALLPGIGTRYERPDVPADASRGALGLPAGVPLFLCPQSLWKIHPDNDALFAQVLLAVPDARLVLFGGRHPAITTQFMVRLSASLRAHGVDTSARVLVLPQRPHADFLRINLACDAMIDTLHWSGGNTSVDALACGLPVLTLPGTHMRGRQSAAMLELMGVPELVARDRDELVALAARAATDAAWRGDVRDRLIAAQGTLFGRDEALDAWTALLQEEAERPA